MMKLKIKGCRTGRKQVLFYTIVISCFIFSSITSMAAYVSVASYGAVGDGTTDDTTAIQNALNTGSDVYFPKTSAYYKVSGCLSYQGHKIFSNGAKIVSTDSDDFILLVSYVDRLYIGDLTIEYQNAPTILGDFADAVKIIYCSDFIIERVTANAILVSASEDGIVRDCRVKNAPYKAYQSYISNDVIITRCHAETNVHAYGTESSSNVLIADNSCEDSLDAAFRVEDSDTVTVENNIARYCLTGAFVYGTDLGETSDNTIKWNTFYNCYKRFTESDEVYVNHNCQQVMGTKMDVDNTQFINNVICGDENQTSEITDLASSTVTINTGSGIAGQVTAVNNSISGEVFDMNDNSNIDYRSIDQTCNYVKVTKGTNTYIPESSWLFYVNLPTAIDLSDEEFITIDCLRQGDAGEGTNGYDPGTLAVKLYADDDRTDYLCTLRLSNPYKGISLTTLLTLPSGVDLSTVKCISFETLPDSIMTEVSISSIRKGLGYKVGYRHEYNAYGSHHAHDTLVEDNVIQSQSVVPFPYVNIRAWIFNDQDPVIYPGTDLVDTTANRPTSPTTGLRYYDTTLESPILWEGSAWMDINTYWPTQIVNKAVNFDGTNYIEIDPDERMDDTNSYTIEGWVKPTTSGGTSGRHIVSRCDMSDPYGFLIQLYTNDKIYVYQTAGGSFYGCYFGIDFPHDGDAHHIAVTFSYDTQSTLTLYIDGVYQYQRVVSSAPDFPPSTEKIKFGNGMIGKLYGFNYYNRALSSSDIALIYKKDKESSYAYWRFNEGSGIYAVDSSPDGVEGGTMKNYGTLIGSPTWTTSGKTAGGLEFDGSSSKYVHFYPNKDLNVNSYTIEGWVQAYTSGNGTARRIMGKYNTSTPYGFLMQLYTDNRLYVYQSVGGNFYGCYFSYAFPTDGAFHHIAMTCSYDGSQTTVKLFIDGTKVNNKTVSGAPDLAPDTTPMIGGQTFKGVIDEFKFHARALSEQEISDSYNKAGIW